MDFSSLPSISLEKKNPIRRKIFFFVFLFHLFLIFCISYSHTKVLVKPQKKLLVKTIIPSKQAIRPVSHKPPKKSAAPLATSAANKPVSVTPQKPKPPSPAKTEPAKKESKKSPAKTSSPVKQKKEIDYSSAKNLTKELEETLANWEKLPKTSANEKSLALPVLKAPKLEASPLHIEPIETSRVSSSASSHFYEESLVKYLQHTLHLPEYGSVKIALTLNPDGTVIQVKVMTSENEKNKVFLEKNLPQIRFPNFYETGTKEPKTFLLTFCNE